MHPYSQVVILGELSISDDDLVKMKAGQTTGQTLVRLAGNNNTAMTLGTLALIKSFIESNINNNGKEQVRNFDLWIYFELQNQI